MYLFYIYNRRIYLNVCIEYINYIELLCGDMINHKLCLTSIKYSIMDWNWLKSATTPRQTFDGLWHAKQMSVYNKRYTCLCRRHLWRQRMHKHH